MHYNLKSAEIHRETAPICSSYYSSLIYGRLAQLDWGSGGVAGHRPIYIRQNKNPARETVLFSQFVNPSLHFCERNAI